MIPEDGENTEILKFFSNAVKNLKISEYQEADPLANNISHPIFRAMMKFRNHPSVIAIKNLNSGSRFDFCRVSVHDVKKEIMRLSTRKATQYSDLPVKILITPVFKKGYKGSNDNYRPVSILPVISKIFEKLLCK